MGVRVKYNHLGAIAREMPKAIDQTVDDVAQSMARELKTTLWVDTGLVRRVTVDRSWGRNHAEVWIGYNRGKGFYSRFKEWGTRKQRAQPIVGPTAHRYEQILAREMAIAVARATTVRG